MLLQYIIMLYHPYAVLASSRTGDSLYKINIEKTHSLEKMIHRYAYGTR